MTGAGVPVRTYGHLVAASEGEKISFVYRPFLVFPERKVEVSPASLSVGRGLFFSTVRDEEANWFLLPPRYRDHEMRVVELYRLPGGVQSAGLRRAWGALKELIGTKATRLPTQPV